MILSSDKRLRLIKSLIALTLDKFLCCTHLDVTRAAQPQEIRFQSPFILILGCNQIPFLSGMATYLWPSRFKCCAKDSISNDAPMHEGRTQARPLVASYSPLAR